MRTALSSCVIASLSLWALPSRADCDAAYEATQRLDRAGRLLDSEHEAATCAAATCPSWMQRDCVGWAQRIRDRIPAVVVHATARDGCDLSEATLHVDGELRAAILDGRPIRLDPGPHTLRVTPGGAPGGSFLETKVVLGDGSGVRTVDVRFAPAGVTCGSVGPAQAKPIAGSSAANESRPVPVAVYVAGAIGVGLVSVGTAFEIVGLTRKNELADCRPACEPARVDSMMSSFLVGDVLVGAGVLSLGVAAVLYFMRPVTESFRARVPARIAF